jgi:hypothetical protein
MAVIGIGLLCVEALVLGMGEGSVDAVVKQRVGQLFLDPYHGILDFVYPSLGQRVLRRGRVAELQRDLDHLVRGQWQVDLPMPRLLHG